MNLFIEKYYWVSMLIFVLGLYMTIVKGNLIKKVIGLNLAQTGVYTFFILTSKVSGGTAPVYVEGQAQYVNPLPHVLILTAIVVGISLTAFALGLVIRIYNAFGTIEEAELSRLVQANEAPTAEYPISVDAGRSGSGS